MSLDVLGDIDNRYSRIDNARGNWKTHTEEQATLYDIGNRNRRVPIRVKAWSNRRGKIPL